MIKPVEETGGSRRRRGSGDSRGRLLEAAKALFAEHGYEKTTVRQIGQAADVDPALIARYFGSKAALYVESLRPDLHPDNTVPLNLSDPLAIQGLLDRIAPSGPTPALHAAVRPHEDAELQAVAMELLKRRLLDPTEERARSAGLDDAGLRAEIAIAALAGIVLSRSSQAFPALANASSADAGRLIASLIGDLTTP